MSDLNQLIPALPPTGAVVPKDTLDAMRDGLNELQAEWGPYVPTLAGFTVGNGALVARYRRVGKSIDFRVRFTAGSTSTFTAAMTFSLPVPMRDDYIVNDALGQAVFFDNSVGANSRAAGTVFVPSIGVPPFENAAMLADASAAPRLVTSAVPWTWATGDTFSASGRYEAAA